MGCGSSKTNKIIEPEKKLERRISIENLEEVVYDENFNESLDSNSEKSLLIQGKNALKSKNFKLNYFDLNCRGELIRLIFAVSDTPFIDQRIKLKDWPQEINNAPLKQLPYLEVDEEPILVQSMAIARYLAYEMNLAGRDKYENVKVDLILDLCKEFVDYYSIYIVPELLYPTDEKEEIIDSFLRDIGVKYLKDIEILVERFGKNDYAVGYELTVADLFIHDLVTNMINLDSFILENYTILRKNRNQVEENRNLKAYLDKRREMNKTINLN